MAAYSTTSAELLCGLLNSLIFMLLGAAFMLGREHFASLYTSTAVAAAAAWQRAWKQYQWRCMSPRQLCGACAGFMTNLVQPRSTCESDCACTISDNGSARDTCATAQEHLAVEVALLLRDGRLLAALELLRNVRLARGSLHCSPSCFRMVLQRLVRSPAKPETLNRLTEEMSASALPTDALSEGCYVRCLCRGPHADVEKAHSAYHAMVAKGVTPDLRTVETLVEACLHVERYDLVKPLILGLDDHGLEPSAALYAALITSCSATGAVACGMVAFDQMRQYFHEDAAATQLGYSATIYMCTQNNQVERALKLLEESRQFSHEQGLAAAALEARLVPTLLAASVQLGREDLAVDLAHQARAALAELQGSAQGREYAAHLDGLCKLLRRRHRSIALMEKVCAVLADAPASSAARVHDGSIPVSSGKPEVESLPVRSLRKLSGVYQAASSVLQLMGSVRSMPKP